MVGITTSETEDQRIPAFLHPRRRLTLSYAASFPVVLQCGHGALVGDANGIRWDLFTCSLTVRLRPYGDPGSSFQAALEDAALFPVGGDWIGVTSRASS